MIPDNFQLQSDTIGKIAGALCKAQSTISAARKDSANPFFKSNYADLGSVTEAIRESLLKNGLAYAQTTLPSESGPTIVTTLMHESGEWIRGALYLPAHKMDAQQFGSAITYARRYALAAMVGVVQEDDDGNAASQPRKPAPRKPVQEAPPVPELIPVENVIAEMEGAFSQTELAEIFKSRWAMAQAHYNKGEMDKFMAAKDRIKAELSKELGSK